MATEFTVTLDDRPGALADLTEVLARNAVNITALHASPCTTAGIVQFIASHADAAIQALGDARIDYSTREVLLLTLPNEPGALARLARALGDQEVNIQAIYITMGGQVVLDVSDITKAQQTAYGLGYN